MKHVMIYTDGSCSGNPGPGGYGAILIYNGTEKEISGGEENTTNNRMELLAPIRALQLLNEPCSVDLYSDSAYVVNSFLNGWIYSWARNGWRKKDGELKNVDLLQELYALCGKHNVTWHKVKGHSDNPYNNRCDELAVSETEKIKKGLSEGSQAEEIRNRIYEGALEETVDATESIFNGRVFRVEKLSVTLPDGHKSTREIVRHNGGAAVVAVDEEGFVYLVRQFRMAAGRIMLEIPAGKLEQNEDPAVCAARELTEETGLTAEKLVHLTSMYATPGYCSEKLHLYLATGLIHGDPHRDPGEFLNIRKYHMTEVMDMIAGGEIEDAKTITGILMADRILH